MNNNYAERSHAPMRSSDPLNPSLPRAFNSGRADFHVGPEFQDAGETAPSRFMVPMHAQRESSLSMNPPPAPPEEGSNRSAFAPFPSLEGSGVGRFTESRTADLLSECGLAAGEPRIVCQSLCSSAL